VAIVFKDLQRLVSRRSSKIHVKSYFRGCKVSLSGYGINSSTN
jgi:hypothetical protein